MQISGRQVQRMLQFYFILTLVILVFAGNSHALLSAQAKYHFYVSENPQIAEQRALLEARKALVDKHLRTVERRLKSGNTGASKDDLYIIAYYSVEMEVVDLKKIKDVIVVDVRGQITERLVDLFSSKIRGDFIVADFKSLMRDYRKNQELLEETKAKIEEARLLAGDPQKMAVESLQRDIQKIENRFLALRSFDLGLHAFLREDYNGAINSFTKAIEDDRFYILAYQYRGRAYGVLGENERRLSDYRKVVELYPDDSLAHYNLSAAYFELGKAKSALEEINKAIQINPKFDKALNNRGSIHVSLGMYDSGIDDFSMAIALNSTYAKAYYNRSYAYYKKYDYERSVQDSSAAILHDPQLAEAYYVRGLSLLELSDGKKGLNDLQKSCGMNFMDACNLIKEELLYKEAWSVFEKGDLSKALQLVESSDNLNYDKLVILRGLVYLNLKRPEEALSSIEKLSIMADEAYERISSARQQVSDTTKEVVSKYYYTLKYIRGSANYQMNKCGQAVRDLSIYEKVDSSDVSVLDMIGTCYYRIGDYSSSMKYYERTYRLSESGSEKISSAYSIASLNALLSNADKVIDWLSIALQSEYKDEILRKIKVDKDFDKVRSDASFQKFLEKQQAGAQQSQ